MRWEKRDPVGARCEGDCTRVRIGDVVLKRNETVPVLAAIRKKQRL